MGHLLSKTTVDGKATPKSPTATLTGDRSEDNCTAMIILEMLLLRLSNFWSTFAIQWTESRTASNNRRRVGTKATRYNRDPRNGVKVSNGCQWGWRHYPLLLRRLQQFSHNYWWDGPSGQSTFNAFGEVEMRRRFVVQIDRPTKAKLRGGFVSEDPCLLSAIEAIAQRKMTSWRQAHGICGLRSAFVNGEGILTNTCLMLSET